MLEAKFENIPVRRRLGDFEYTRAYINMGKDRAKAWLKEIGAERRAGRRILYDLEVVDKTLDALRAGDAIYEPKKRPAVKK